MEASDRQMTGVGAAAAAAAATATAAATGTTTKHKVRRLADTAGQKRRCVSTACIACRKRKSKCDGASPKCAACQSVYGTECVYDPGSDHRRKGVYREKLDSAKARSSTLQILIDAIRNAGEDEVAEIVRKIRTCENLDALAEQPAQQDFMGGSIDDDDHGHDHDDLDHDDLDHDNDHDGLDHDGLDHDDHDDHDEGSVIAVAAVAATTAVLQGERELARKMGELRFENDSVRFIGGTSHLIYLGGPTPGTNDEPVAQYRFSEDPIMSWTDVTNDTKLIIHLMNMYFTYHYTFFTTLSKSMFYRDFLAGRASLNRGTTTYCSSLLVNAMLALGCHFTNVTGAYAVQGDTRTKGDHFFAEAKRLITANDEYEKPRLATVQALALLSMREAGCAREAKGWVYSGMSFRMAQDIGLDLDITGGDGANRMSEYEIDARRITFWGCFLFDKAWSNYLGRLPQLPQNACSVPKYDVFPDEDAETWSPYRDDGFDLKQQQPSRIRAVGLQSLTLNEISSDLLLFFYHPHHIQRPRGKAAKLKKLSVLHRRLEDWRRALPKEMEPKEGQLPNVILMHMFFHLQYLHLFKPFLKYTPTTSPLPPHISPRRICTANAGAISKLMRLYKKSWGLRQVCNIAVYITHSSCIIHLLNLPDRTAKRDITHGVRHLEEIAEDWLCARRTLAILSVLARKWRCELPDEAAAVLQRTDEKYGAFATSEVPSPTSSARAAYMAASPNASLSSIAIPIPQTLPNQHNKQPQILFMPSSIMSGVGPSAPAPAPKAAATAAARALGSPLPVSAPTATPCSIDSWPPLNMPLTSDHTNMMVPFLSDQRPETATLSNTRSFSPTSTQLRTPSSVDGQEWFMHDSIKWQQNFEPWGNVPSTTTAQPHRSQGQEVQGPDVPRQPCVSPAIDNSGVLLYRGAVVGQPATGIEDGVGIDDSGHMNTFDELDMVSMGWGGLAGLE